MATPELPNFARTISGPTLLGTFFNLVLLGVLITQCSVYFKAPRRDRPWIRMLVLLLLILEIVQSVLAIAFIYDRLVNNFGNMLAQATPTPLIQVETLFVGLISMIVQMFFAWRVRVLTGRKWLGWLVTVLAAISGSASFVLSILSWTLSKGFLNQGVILQNMAIVWLVGDTITDSVITVVLVAHLQRRRTGFASTDRIIDRVIGVTLQTGLLTAVSAAVNLILYLTTSTTADQLMVNIALAKLYSNSLVSSLNVRSDWRSTDEIGGKTSNGGESQIVSNARRNVFGTISHGTRHGPEVFVEIESHELRDVEGAKSDEPMKQYRQDL
jgi:hypothetical protein